MENTYNKFADWSLSKHGLNNITPSPDPEMVQPAHYTVQQPEDVVYFAKCWTSSENSSDGEDNVSQHNAVITQHESEESTQSSDTASTSLDSESARGHLTSCMIPTWNHFDWIPGSGHLHMTGLCGRLQQCENVENFEKLKD